MLGRSKHTMHFPIKQSCLNYVIGSVCTFEYFCSMMLWESCFFSYWDTLSYHINHLGKFKTKTRIEFWFWPCTWLKYSEEAQELFYMNAFPCFSEISLPWKCILWCSCWCALGVVMLLYYSAKCLEVKENAYIVISSGNTNNISFEEAPCIQRTSATKVRGAIICKLQGRKLGGGKPLPFSINWKVLY